MKGVIGEVFPELAEIGFTDSRVGSLSPQMQDALTDIHSSCVGIQTVSITK